MDYIQGHLLYKAEEIDMMIHEVNSVYASRYVPDGNIVEKGLSVRVHECLPL